MCRSSQKWAARHVPVVTTHPDGTRITQHARSLVMDPGRGRLPPVPDRDAGFMTAFDAILASEGLEVAETPPAAQRRRRSRDVRLGSADPGLAQSLLGPSGRRRG
jgi:hypothetical protein